VNGNVIYSDEKGKQLPGNKEHRMGHAVWKKHNREAVGGTWHETEEDQSRLRSTDGN